MMTKFARAPLAPEFKSAFLSNIVYISALLAKISHVFELIAVILVVGCLPVWADVYFLDWFQWWNVTAGHSRYETAGKVEGFLASTEVIEKLGLLKIAEAFERFP